MLTFGGVCGWNVWPLFANVAHDAAFAEIDFFAALRTALQEQFNTVHHKRFSSLNLSVCASSPVSHLDSITLRFIQTLPTNELRCIDAKRA